MTTPYIDPNIIFAENAPTQDKPAAFENYDKGWDESRKNDGRPEIKQMNYLQQQADLKNRYIHENGAALPYKEGVSYEENAVVVKDGFIQQKNGSSWAIPFMRGSQNLAELTDVAQARTKLDVYAKSEALSRDNNLSELPNKATARTNLGVYSKAETEGIAGTPNATETVAGKAKIATTAIAQAGVNNTDFITAKKLRDALNASGTAPMYACRAWVNFDGINNNIRAGGNVSSVTDNGTGDYTVNLATPLQDQNYSIVATINQSSGNTDLFVCSIKSIDNSSVRISCRQGNKDFTANIDSNILSVAIFQ